MKKLKILFEDKYIIVVYKESGLLTIGNDSIRDNTLYSYVKDYVKKKNKNNKIFIVHRLDRDTSGLVMFAKSEKIKTILQSNWSNVIRKYYAVVHGRSKKYSRIESYLKETSTLYTYSSSNGLRAIAEYYTLKSNNKYSLLDIRIYTGRKNQIRVHMKDEGLPIVGDRKYGIKDKSHYMMLLAYYLGFKHPVTSLDIIINLELPDSFNNYFSN